MKSNRLLKTILTLGILFSFCSIDICGTNHCKIDDCSRSLSSTNKEDSKEDYEDLKLSIYKNPIYPAKTRAYDLLQKMTIEEKIAQISHLHSWNVFDGGKLNKEKLRTFCGENSFGFFEGFPLSAENCRATFREIQSYMCNETRLGIPAFPVAESLHGVVQDGATIYPQNIALGSTFNKKLAYQKAKYISGELNTMGVKQVLAPCIDVVRELRWGRVEESYSEDPFLCSEMAVQEVLGYRDHGISPMLKHYGPHGNPQSGLNLASVECSVADLFDIYLKPFEKVIEKTDIKAVMSSYNAWNRTPNSASHFMLTEILRNKFGFEGYVYSDWGVIDMLKTFHKTAANDSEAAYQALSAGLDVEASSQCFKSLIEKVRNHEIDIKLIDQAVLRVLISKFELGLFEDPFQEKATWRLPMMNKESVAISRQIADESSVLLKNANDILPLNRKKLKSIAVIGPNADKVQFGDYTWSKNKSDGVTPLEGIKSLVGDRIKINYAKGCSIASLDESGFSEAINAAKNSDLSVVFVGSSSTSFVRHSAEPSTSGEGIDLNDISLTGAQENLLKEIKKTGKPMIVVLVAGKPFAIPWVKENADAVIAQWYAGQEEGNSIAAILFGDVNPSGKLSFTFPQSTGHLPVFYNHLSTDRGFYHEPGSINHPGRDYVFSSPDALWPFGYGLSYTSFEYLNAETDKYAYNAHDTIRVSVTVKNSGKDFGKEVVQVYVNDVVSSIMTPVKELKAFEKISLKPDEIKEIILEIPVHELYLTDNFGNRFAEAGEFEIQVGCSSEDIKFNIPIYMGKNTNNIQNNFNNSKENNNEEFSSEESSSEMSSSEMSSSEDFSFREEDGRLIKISGEVRDVQATPIKGARVTDGTGTYETFTDSKGQYIIKAHKFGSIIFSKKGYAPQRAKINGAKEISIQLKK